MATGAAAAGAVPAATGAPAAGAAGVAGTTLDVGLDSEAEFFGNDLNVATKNYYKSARGTTTRDISKITTRLNQLSNQGQISVRVHYFMPSEYMFEF